MPRQVRIEFSGAMYPVDGKVGEHYFGQMRPEVAQAEAERIAYNSRRTGPEYVPPTRPSGLLVGLVP